jgi:NAD(P)-dependent dehydrogenase (short-subunit alcohol dehydrogenase family)
MAGVEGKRVLVTGGLGTIGRALVSGFVREGASVTVLDRPGGEAPAGVGWIGADLGDLPGACEAVAAAIEAGGGFDVVVSNAALMVNKPFEAFSLEEYEAQVRVNSSALFALAKVCAPAMRAKGWGRMMCMSSVTLTGQWHGYVPYVASKGALVGLVKTLARELGGDGITVNAIAPGAVRSEAEDRVVADKLQEYQDWIIKNQCLKARIEAEDVAELALFLASDRARMITGQNIHVDGGW